MVGPTGFLVLSHEFEAKPAPQHRQHQRYPADNSSLLVYRQNLGPNNIAKANTVYCNVAPTNESQHMSPH